MKISKIMIAIKMVPWVTGILLLLIIQTSCSKQNELKQPSQASASANSNLPLAALATDSGLIAYKNSPHLLMMGYYRTWGDYYVAYKAGNPKMTDMPDSVDILSVFADYTPDSSQYWVQLKNNYIPTLHSKGTKVIFTTGSYPSATDTATVNTWARGILSSINTYNYDGVDLDLETSNGSLPSSAIIARQKAGIDALSKYLGPKSGTNKLLIYDTNTDGGGSSGLVAGVKDEINYVFLQAYWRTTSSLTSTLGTYTPYIPKSKLLVGVDFEDGTGEQPGQMPAYTQWAIQNQTGGVFSYGIDNEYFQVSGSLHNIYTRAAIQAMNPASSGSGTGIVSGATYQLISAVNNSSVLDVTGNGTTNGTKVELWSKNSPASTNQEWIITSVGSNGYYTLQPANASGMLLDVGGGGSTSTTNGTQIDIWTANGSTSQQWKITSSGNGYYNLSPVSNLSYSLDVYGGNTANGTKIETWTTNSPATNSQKWQLVKQ